MQEACYHAIGLVFAVALAILGRFVTRHPERMVRFFTFGAANETGFFVGFSRAVGWFYFVGGILGVITYLIMIPFDLMHSR